MKLNKQTLDEYVAKDLLSCRKHPTLDLYCLKYTADTQFSCAWDEITLNCRGTVVDGEGNVVTRPLDKFFNLNEKDRTGEVPGSDQVRCSPVPYLLAVPCGPGTSHE
jgi:RNA ligase